MIDPIVILFYGFALLGIAAATFTVCSKNTVRSALGLMLTFVATSGVWLLAHAEFLAMALILVYVGAVMVLFLFVVMMLNIDNSVLKAKFVRYLPITTIVAIGIIFCLGYAFLQVSFTQTEIKIVGPMAANMSIESLGLELYTKYLLHFELAGIILLIAIVAAISLTFRKSRAKQSLSPSEQVQIRKEDRLRMIKDL